MAANSSRVVPIATADRDATAPRQTQFIETTLSRALKLRLDMVHEQRSIAVFKGPWGIGKTTSITAFAQENDGTVVVVKVEPGSSKKGTTPIHVMQLVVEALREMYQDKRSCLSLSNAYWTMRKMVFDQISRRYEDDCLEFAQLTIVFDEAQYLSREAIEMLRYWNDADRTVMPFPVGLVFVGNDDFSLREDGRGESVISGAVRSRALFIEAFDYDDLTAEDIVAFVRSRGVTDPGAISVIADYYAQPRVRRDLRQLERLLVRLNLLAGGGPVTQSIARDALAIR